MAAYSSALLDVMNFQCHLRGRLRHFVDIANCWLKLGKLISNPSKERRVLDQQSDDNRGIVAYSGLMKAVGFRLLASELHLSKCQKDAEDPNLIDIEIAALQLRQVCETILLSSFVLHSDFVVNLTRKLRKADGWNRLKKILEGENPKYMPSPVKIVDLPNGERSLDVEVGNVISGSELFKMWGQFSEVLHYRNPLKGDLERPEFVASLHLALVRITKLVRHHSIHLPGDDVIYIVYFSIENGSPLVQWKRLNRIQ